MREIKEFIRDVLAQISDGDRAVLMVQFLAALCLFALILLGTGLPH